VVTNNIVLDSGQYTKIDSYQINTAMVANHAHMPFPYLPDSVDQADTIYSVSWIGKKWLKGILFQLKWGDIETADGVFSWTLPDAILNTVRGLPKATGKNKKVLFLISTRAPGSLNVGKLIPIDATYRKWRVLQKHDHISTIPDWRYSQR
jgi:hypothetical protein